MHVQNHWIKPVSALAARVCHEYVMATSKIKLRLHTDAEGGIGMQPQFYLGNDHDVLMTNTDSKNEHRFNPTIPNMHSSLILNSPNLKNHGNLGVMRMTQITPTLARLLNVSLSPQANQPLEALLKIPTPQ